MGGDVRWWRWRCLWRQWQFEQRLLLFCLECRRVSAGRVRNEASRVVSTRRRIGGGGRVLCKAARVAVGCGLGVGGGAGKVKAGSSGSLGVLSCSAGFVKMRVNLLCRCVNLMCRCVNLMCRCVNLMCRCLARCSQVTTQVGLAISRHLLILRATSVHILLEMRV